MAFSFSPSLQTYLWSSWASVTKRMLRTRSVIYQWYILGLLRRCVNCRSRGDLGSCKDPFTMNSTAIEMEKGVDSVPCASGWCGKILEQHGINNGKNFIHIDSDLFRFVHDKNGYSFRVEYGTATQRLCFQRGPDDGEERCAYTVWNYKKVYMCLCFGDLCNGATKLSISNGFILATICVLIRLFNWIR